MLEASVKSCPDYHRNFLSGTFIIITSFPYVFYGVALVLTHYERYMFYTFMFIGMVWNQVCGVAFSYAIDFTSLPSAECAINPGAHIDDNCASAVFVSLYFIIGRYRTPQGAQPRANWEEFKYYSKFILITTLIIASNLYLELWTTFDMIMSAMFALINAPLFCFIVIDIIAYQLEHPFVKVTCEIFGVSTDRIGRDWPSRIVADRGASDNRVVVIDQK